MVVCGHPRGAMQNAAKKRDSNTLILVESLAISVLAFLVVVKLFAMNYQISQPLSSIRGAARTDWNGV
jgi:hypothetical protein